MDLIPAAPGWYVLEVDGEREYLDPVIAWKSSADSDGDDILLPAVDGGLGYPPIFLNEESFKEFSRRVVYRPSHVPAEEQQ